MAKGSNNLRSRPSDASKPYDVSNSFVKRVATRVSELLPQPSWLSRWISPASVPNANDFSGHSLSSTITSRPPATSRAELNLVDNVDHHVPAKKPRTGRFDSPVNQNKFLRGDVNYTEDISPITVRGEPVAGPSSAHPEFISSTPAVHVQQQNSAKVNGDDCSETSESTSGCSSLVPQAQSTNRSLGGRYERMLPPETTVDSLHRRRPSFSTTTFSSPLRASMRERLGSSPFYSGRTMYGGSSQAYLSTIHSPQRRVGPSVKPVPGQQSLPLSSTAKRILDALEQFSTPVMDAKRMPMTVGSKRKLESSSQRYLELNVPSTPDLLRVKRRERLQQSTSAARETATASLPSPQSPTEYTIRKDEEEPERKKHTGKVKRKDKVADETAASVKLPAVVLSMENLPKIDIAIPPAPPVQSQSVTNSATGSLTPSFASTSKFMFSTPTAVSLSASEVQSVNIPTSSFQFSAPISESCCKTSVISDINKPVLSSNISSLTSRTSSDSLTSHPKRHRSKNDTSESLDKATSGSVVNPLQNSADISAWKLPPSSTTVTIQSIGSESECKHCLKKIEYPGFFCSSCQKTQQDSVNDKIGGITTLWECHLCKSKNPSSFDACVLCHTKKQPSSLDSTKNNVKSPSTTGFGNLYKKPVGTWECSTCMIQNKNNATKCVACETPKPNEKEKTFNTSKIDNTTFSSTSVSSSGFGDKFKKPSGSWECQSCMITNKPNDTHCVACETPKEGVISKVPTKLETVVEIKQSGNGFGSLFAKAPGSWTCDTCMITNKAEVIKCAACETLKPGATSPKTEESSTPKFSFGIPTTVISSSLTTSTTFSFGINKGDQIPSALNTSLALPKTSGKTGHAQTQASPSSQQFSFGIPKTEEIDKTIGITSTTKPMLQLSSVSEQTTKLEPKSSMFVNPAPSKLSVSAPIFGSTGKNSSTKNEVLNEVKSVGTTELASTSNISLGVKPAVSSFSLKDEKSSSETTSSTASLFTFGSNNVVKCNNEKLSEANSKPPQPSAMFGTKQGSYGSNVAASTTSTISTSLPSNVFKFGETKSVSSGADISSISSVNTQSSFTVPKGNNLFSFGPSAEKKETSFGVTASKETVSTSVANLKSDDKKTTFGSFGTASSQETTFGNANTFGNNAFVTKEQPAPNPFVPQTTSNVFGASESTNASSTSTFSGFGQNNAFQSASQENKPSAVFTFGSTATKEPAPTGGFAFNPVLEKRAETGFGFTSTQQTQSGPTFNFNNPSSTPSSTFNFEAKPFGSPFSAANDTTPVFGTTTPLQPTPAFGEQTNQTPVFAFGSQSTQPSQTQANPMFEFGSTQQQSTPLAPASSTTFLFGATSAAPAAPSFDPNIKPTFNFTQGTTPVLFSAIPTVNSTGPAQPAHRKIRKAIRRANISSVRQT